MLDSTQSPAAGASQEGERAETEPQIRLLLDRIVKRFPGVVANDEVTFDVRAGEIHALLGENGAGKSTLMEIAYGVYQPDGGRIVIDEVECRHRSPSDAIERGVGMVHQHFMLVPILSVAANLALELRSRSPILRLAPVAQRIAELSHTYGLLVDPDAKVEELSVGQLQRVEIVKALFRDAQILILDEPTSLLTAVETEQLFRVMRELRAEGRSIVFISHKLSEVMTIADRVTVLRQGKQVATHDKTDVDERQLARLMVGEKNAAALLGAVEEEAHTRGPVVARLSEVTLTERRRPLLSGIDLEVHSGEILGIAGVEENGQRELAEVLVGLQKPTAGTVEICGTDIRKLAHVEVAGLGVGFIPEDRHEEGLVLNFSLEENIFLRRQRRTGLTVRGVIRQRPLRRLAEELVRQFGISAPNTRVAVGKLSGGNQQKVILARELAGEPKLIVASQPTRGLDIAATSYVHGQLQQHRARGAATVLISTNLDEVLALSDRIAVMYEGGVVGTLDRGQATSERIGLLMAGRKVS